MAQQISAAEIDQFCRKLEAFSDTLSDSERTVFKGILDTISDEALGQAQGGVPSRDRGLDRGFTVQSFAPRLDFSFFRRVIMPCW
jgi:hypothetical protein